MMSDYYKQEEIELLEKPIRSIDWSYTITPTIDVDSPSIGDVWLRCQEGVDRLLKLDKSAVYCLFVCVNKEETSWKRPHAHGLIKTRLPLSKVKACFFLKQTHIRPYTKKGPGDWIGYTTGQAIRDTQLTNMEIEDAKTED
jgi:hypothetical protein